MANTSKHVVSGFLQRRQRGALTNRSPNKPLRLQFEQLEERLLLSISACHDGPVDISPELAPFVSSAPSQCSADEQPVLVAALAPDHSEFSLVSLSDLPRILCFVSTFAFPGGGECSGDIDSTPRTPSPEPSNPPVIEEDVLAPPPPQAELLLDPTFGTDGIVKMEFNGGGVGGGATAVLSQPDGKIIIAGGIGVNGTLIRYNVDGSIDTSFGDGGIATVTLDYDFEFYDLAIQDDGKILATGFSWSHEGLVTVRITPDGLLDADFGVGGVVDTEQEESHSRFGRSVVVQPDGKILLGSGSGSSFVLIRYNPDGSLDTDFADGGRATGDFDCCTRNSVSVKSIAVQDDGKIVVVAGGSKHGGLVRFNVDGTLDTTFGTDGKVSDTGSYYAQSVGLVLQDDGQIVVSGKYGIRRFHTDGSRDNSFGKGDKIGTYRFMLGRSLAIDDDGNFIVAGSVLGPRGFDGAGHVSLAPRDIGVAIYNSDGLPIAKDRIDLGSRRDRANAVSFLPDGSVVVAGGYSDRGDVFALVRYQVFVPEDGADEGSGGGTADASLETGSFLALAPDVFDPVTFDAVSAPQAEPDTPRPDAVQDETVDLALTELTSDDEQDDGTGYLGGGRIETHQTSPTDEALIPDPSLLPPVVNLLLGISG